MPELDNSADDDDTTTAGEEATTLFPHEAMLLRGIAELAYQEQARNHASLKSLTEHLDHQFEAMSTHSGDEPVKPNADDADPSVALLGADPWTEYGLTGARVPGAGYQECIRVPDDLLSPAADPLISGAEKVADHYYGQGREAEAQLIDERITPVLSSLKDDR